MLWKVKVAWLGPQLPEVITREKVRGYIHFIDASCRSDVSRTMQTRLENGCC